MGSYVELYGIIAALLHAVNEHFLFIGTIASQLSLPKNSVHYHYKIIHYSYSFVTFVGMFFGTIVSIHCER